MQSRCPARQVQVVIMSGRRLWLFPTDTWYLIKVGIKRVDNLRSTLLHGGGDHGVPKIYLGLPRAVKSKRGKDSASVLHVKSRWRYQRDVEGGRYVSRQL